MHDHKNFRPLRHADGGTRDLQSPSRFAKCVDGKGFSIVASRVPLTLADFKVYRKDAIAKFARRQAVIVRGDRRCACSLKPQCSGGRNQHGQPTPSVNPIPSHIVSLEFRQVPGLFLCIRANLHVRPKLASGINTIIACPGRLCSPVRIDDKIKSGGYRIFLEQGLVM
jgi:hypothetical protein